MNITKLCGALSLACIMCSAAQAATITAVFDPAGSSWQAQLAVTNDGAPAQIGHFTLYFDETMFSGLSLLQSPPGWDSVVVPPDALIPAPGFLDALVLPGTPPLVLGQTQGGFTVGFAYSGMGVPGPLHFEIIDDGFNVLFQGQTLTVPEPHAWQLSLLGLAALSRRFMRGAQPPRCRRQLHP